MLKHIVLWKFKEYAAGRGKTENLRDARSALLALAPVVPAIRHREVGINAVEGEQAYDLALIVEVEDTTGLEQYLEHPRHREVSERLSAWRESRVCVDMFF